MRLCDGCGAPLQHEPVCRYCGNSTGLKVYPVVGADEDGISFTSAVSFPYGMVLGSSFVNGKDIKIGEIKSLWIIPEENANWYPFDPNPFES